MDRYIFYKVINYVAAASSGLHSSTQGPVSWTPLQMRVIAMRWCVSISEPLHRSALAHFLSLIPAPELQIQSVPQS